MSRRSSDVQTTLIGVFCETQCVVDVPCILLAEEMIAAYSEAKVILTHRPVDGALPLPPLKTVH